MSKWKHRISDVDAINKTGNCLECGPVTLSVKSGKFKCWIAKQEQRGVRPPKAGGHGLTHLQAASLKQDRVCEICGRSDRLVVDHDHKSGMIRGILCHWCNVAIGMMFDDPAKLRLAATYLEK